MKMSSAWKKLVGAWAVLAMLLAMTMGAAEETVTVKIMNIVNGGFEDGVDGFSWPSSYSQPNQDKVPGWCTSAFEGKIELFKKNTGVYINGVTLEPKEGLIAAELNADEESTLYQVLETEPFSTYEWGLYHGSRTSQDTMALIIGPNQMDEKGNCLLSKPNKAGRDQFMQMIDWLKKDGNGYNDGNYKNGLYNSGTPIILYSKKFGAGGTFQDNASDSAFSLTPSAIYTEAWCIWLMRDQCAQSGENPWTRYGSGAAMQPASGQENGGEPGSAYYQYMVPAGQTSSLFGFVSVDSALQRNTYGNFLDGIDFEIFRRLTASSTANGTATITDENELKLSVSVDHSVSAYVPDGVELTLTATIAKEDTDSVAFAGVFYRGSGGQTVFIANNEESSWTEEVSADGARNFIRKLKVNGACDLHFVFVRSPMVTYDANGGDPYNCGQSETEECIYNFQPVMENGIPRLIEPYKSHAAVKTAAAGTPDPDWRFIGWMMLDDNGEMKMLEDRSGEHRVACNYSFSTGSSGTGMRQKFLVIGREDAGNALPDFLPDTEVENDGNGHAHTLKRWRAPDTAMEHYNGLASGLTFIAQWRWRQTYMPMLRCEDTYERSGDGGRIYVNVMTTDEHGHPETKPAVTEPPEGDRISQCYFAEMQETMAVTATANPGYEFEGWYTPDGTLVTTHNTLSYVVGKGEVAVYEARFSGTAMQRYIRQIPDESGNWIEVPKGANVPVLDHTGYEVSPGTAVTCTTGESTKDYAFEGWYEIQNGEYVKVSDSMVTPDGLTLSYVVTGNATYYARYVPKVRLVACYVDSNNRVTTAPVSGEVYGRVDPAVASELPGKPISSQATAGTGYRFVGWYDSKDDDRTLLSRDALYSGEMPPVGKTYYAMFTAGDNSRYKVQHIKVKPDGSEEIASQALSSGETTGRQVSAQEIAIPGYAYRADSFTVNGTTYQSNPSGKVRGDGQLVLKLYYTPTDTPYRIEYYKLDAQGNETLAGTENKTGKTDETVSVTAYEDRYASAGYSFA
ncbi:MAG: hypothetical protein PUC00_06985, partial [Clostridiales bacterium]|nr:hypothetical protein [Clostridiales bacterium]